MRIFLVASTVLCLAVLSGFAQTVQLSQWRTLSSLRGAVDATTDIDGTIWVATIGGVFAFNPQTNESREYRNIGALQSLTTSAILYESSSNTVIVGGQDGSIDIRQSDDSWINLTDIRRASQYPKRGITDIIEHNGLVYISTEFGFVTFDPVRQVFVETIDRVGSIPEKTRCNGVAILRDSIWVATDSGLAVAPLNVSSLRPPSIWTRIEVEEGNLGNRVSLITSDGQNLGVSTGFSAYQYNNGSFNVSVQAPASLLGLTLVNGELFASFVGGVKGSVQGDVQASWSGTVSGHTNINLRGEAALAVFAIDNGVDLWDWVSVRNVLPNSPVSNKFAKIVIDSRGGFWTVTDVEPPNTGQGAAYFDGTNWIAITKQNNANLTTNACYRVSALDNGKVLIGTWGGGALVASVENGELVTNNFNSSNSIVQGIASDNNYALVADAVVDNFGNMWAINEQSATQLFLNLNEDGSGLPYSNCVNRTDNLFRTIAVDGAGNKWAGSPASGLLVFNEGATNSSSDDMCQVVRASNTQLPDNAVTALKLDKVGALWVGTAKGVAVISSPTRVSNSSLPFVRRITAISQNPVNDIYVDALNYKWVATNSGVFVLNEDGTEVLATITTATSPILTDNILSVAVDDETGTVYLGSAQGCNVAQTSSIRPLSSFEIKAWPQPFSTQSGSDLVIDGLAPDSELRILTLGGITVNAIAARGKQALWDGRDSRGDVVPPGVYLIHATSALTGESAVHKIAVKR